MATNAMTDSFRHFLENCDANMRSQIFTALDQGFKHNNTSMNVSVTNAGVSKTEKKPRKKATSDLEAVGPKRPLNSWMAFRSEYRE
jgi:hypothetical protein